MIRTLRHGAGATPIGVLNLPEIDSGATASELAIFDGATLFDPD